MDIEICERQAAALPQGLARTRLRAALRRLGGWVMRVHVRLSDDNGPRGGVDQRCQLRLQTRQGHALVVTAVAEDARAAFELALQRLARLLGRLHTRVAQGARVPLLRHGELLAWPGSA